MNDTTSSNAPDPRSDELCLRAFGALQVGDHRRAEGAALQAAKRQPRNPHPLALLALARRGRGRFREAEESARQALELNPRPDFEFVLGLCLWSAGDPAGARKLFEKALEQRPERSDMLMDLAGFLLHQRQFDEALELAKKARALAPDHPKLPLLLACAEQGVWRPEVDALAFRPPIPLEEDRPETFVRLGVSHMDSGYLDLALDEFSRALDLDAGHREAQSLYATTFYMRKNGFFSWARTWRRGLRRPASLAGWSLPAILLLGSAAVLAQAQQLLFASICGGLGLAYVLVLAYAFNLGGRSLTPEQFQLLVQYRNLTPQGRKKTAEKVVDELYEAQDTRRGRRRRKGEADWAMAPAHVPQQTGTGEDPTLIRRQLEDRSRTLRHVSNSFFGLFVVAGLALIWTVIRKNTPGLLITEQVVVIERLSAAATLACMGVALWFRMKAREVASRI